MEIVSDSYELTKSFPESERFGLTSQIRRSAVSIPSNIAEGAGRKTDKDFLYFLSISLGSQYELETQMLLSTNVGLLSKELVNKFIDKLNELQRMTRTFMERLS